MRIRSFVIIGLVAALGCGSESDQGSRGGGGNPPDRLDKSGDDNGAPDSDNKRSAVRYLQPSTDAGTNEPASSTTPGDQSDTSANSADDADAGPTDQPAAGSPAPPTTPSDQSDAAVQPAADSPVPPTTPSDQPDAGPAQPPPVCSVTVAPSALLCLPNPLGSPASECSYFGLASQGKDGNLTGLSVTSTQKSYVAIVKSGTGGCSPGSQAYRVYVNVAVGDTLSTPGKQDISHVTYCACPGT